MDYPRLSHDPPGSPSFMSHGDGDEGEDELSNDKEFLRSRSPTRTTKKRGARFQEVREEETCKMHKFSLYETVSRFYLVGADVMDSNFRILKIDRMADSGDLSIVDDDIVYSKNDMNQLLSAVDDGNKSSGGLKLRRSTWGLLGFIRFTGEYYMLLITKRSQVAIIGGHYVYQIDGTELISLTSSSSSRSKADRHPEEARFVSILNNLDLSRSFYFSYSYDITNTLQRNIQRERQALQQTEPKPPHMNYNEMFIWNHHLLQPASLALKNMCDWCIPIIHGFVDQASMFCPVLDR